LPNQLLKKFLARCQSFRFVTGKSDFGEWPIVNSLRVSRKPLEVAGSEVIDGFVGVSGHAKNGKRCFHVTNRSRVTQSLPRLRNEFLLVRFNDIVVGRVNSPVFVEAV